MAKTLEFEDLELRYLNIGLIWLINEADKNKKHERELTELQDKILSKLNEKEQDKL